jgi:hypothetical protein
MMRVLTEDWDRLCRGARPSRYIPHDAIEASAILDAAETVGYVVAMLCLCGRPEDEGESTADEKAGGGAAPWRREGSADVVDGWYDTRSSGSILLPLIAAFSCTRGVMRAGPTGARDDVALALGFSLDDLTRFSFREAIVPLDGGDDPVYAMNYEACLPDLRRGTGDLALLGVDSGETDAKEAWRERVRLLNERVFAKAGERPGKSVPVGSRLTSGFTFAWVYVARFVLERARATLPEGSEEHRRAVGVLEFSLGLLTLKPVAGREPPYERNGSTLRVPRPAFLEVEDEPPTSATTTSP